MVGIPGIDFKHGLENVNDESDWSGSHFISFEPNSNLGWNLTNFLKKSRPVSQASNERMLSLLVSLKFKTQSEEGRPMNDEVTSFLNCLFLKHCKI